MAFYFYVPSVLPSFYVILYIYIYLVFMLHICYPISILPFSVLLVSSVPI